MESNARQNDITLDRTRGCIVGGAVGDALGYAVEFDRWPHIQWKYGVRGIMDFQLDRRGLAPISDDTQMSLFTAAGILLGLTRAYMRGIMGRIDTYCQWTYLDWLHTQTWSSRREDMRVDSWLMDEPELYARRSPGNTCLSALRALESGKPVQNDSCGCGGVMRTAPLAVLSYIHGFNNGDLGYRDMSAAEAARITHKHPLGFFPSAVLNHILMRIMGRDCDDGTQLVSIVEESIAALPNIISETDGGRSYGDLWPKHVAAQQDIIKKALELAGTNKPEVDAIESIGGGWTGHEALAIAIYSAVKHSQSFEDAIICSVNHSGDSDSTGAVCGNIIGCMLGRKAIPPKYTDRLELIDVIEEIAHDLRTGCIISEYDPIDTEEKKRWYWKYIKHRREPQECD